MNTSVPDAGRRPAALVTGGRRGLGLSAARHLAENGFDLVIADLVAPGDAEDGLQAIREAGASVAYVQGDIADVESLPGFVDRVWEPFGGIDCLVNNAGVAARPLLDVLELGVEAFDLNINVNLRGTFFLTQAVAKRMLATPSSAPYRSIVSITSLAAEYASLERAQYCIAKAGLSMASNIFALRLASSDIHVHEVRPGFIATDMTASGGTSELDTLIRNGKVPLRRWGQPDDVGHAVATLASGLLPYMTGQVTWVDGGIHIRDAS